MVATEIAQESGLRAGGDPYSRRIRGLGGAAQLIGETAPTGGRHIDGAHVFPEQVFSEVVSVQSFGRLRSDWESLCERALFDNVFAGPDIAAAADDLADSIRVLLAWSGREEHGRRLVGAWPVAVERRRQTWPLRALVSPVIPLAYLGSPVVDRDLVRQVFCAFLKTVRDGAALPKLAHVGDLNAELLPGLQAAARELGIEVALLEKRSRACLRPSQRNSNDATTTRKGKKGKGGSGARLKRLSSLGDVHFGVATETSEVAEAVEEFLHLEAAGWKGRRGTSLASHERSAQFTRSALAGLAEHQAVEIHSLRLDGRPVAMGVVLLSGSSAFTWRTAYDEAYRKYSPGGLLLNDTTKRLLGEPSLSFVDSCNDGDTGFQAARWPDRHELAEVMVAFTPALGRVVRGLALKEVAYRRAKHMARRLRNQLRSRSPFSRRRMTAGN